MSDLKKAENLRKMSLVQLREILERENILLSNNKLIEKLSDKGESIKKFRDKVEREIKVRNELRAVEASANKLSLTDDDKHVHKLYEIEKIPGKDRYKPFATLNKVQQVQPDSKIFKIIEDCTACNNPTKLILLPESMDLLKKQDERVKEEQVRMRHKRILDKLKEYEEMEATEERDSESANSGSESEQELEEGNG